MKSLLRFLSHPGVQVLSFSVLLVESPSLGGPFLFAVVGGVIVQYSLFAFVGILGIIITLLSLRYKPQKTIQLIGAFIMTASVILFWSKTNPENARITFSHMVPVLSYIIYGLVLLARIIYSEPKRKVKAAYQQS